MTQIRLSSAPGIRATLKEALALFLWRFKNNFFVLLPVLAFCVFVQHKGLVIAKGLIASGQTIDTLSLASLSEILQFVAVWYSLYFLAVLLAYIDVIRRSLGLPLYIRNKKELWHYCLWLLKRAWVVVGIITIMLLVYLLIMTGYNGVGLLVANLFPSVGLVLLANKSLILGFSLFAAILLIAHYYLLTYPIAVDRNEGIWKSMKTGLFLAKLYRNYSYQMSMMWLVIFLSQLMVLQIYLQLHVILLDWGWENTAYALYLLVPSTASLFINWFLLCLQMAVYRALTKKALKMALRIEP